jgi:hypothetical protein
MVDRRYGRNKYGDGKLYGASTDMETLAWDVSFDWDGDGIFESNESHHLQGVKVTRGRTGMLNENGVGFREIPTGRAVLTFHNNDRRYDAWNTSSPIYPMVNYGVEVRIRVRKLDDGIVYPVMRGTVTGIVPSGYGSKPAVDFTVSDGLMFLRNTYSRVEEVQENITVDEAILLVLAGAKYRWGVNLDATSETIPYWWSSGNVIAMTELERLAVSFMGYFFADRENKGRFIARGTPYQSVSTLEQEQMLKDVGNPQPYDIYRNVVRLKVHPRTRAASGTIFQLQGEVPTIPAGQSLVLFGDYSYNGTACPAINVIPPAASTDYALNTQRDGLGSDLTGSFTRYFYNFGDTFKIVLVNGSASTAYLTLLKVRGDAIYETDTADVTYPPDTDIVTQPRELFVDLAWQQDVNIAIDIANVQGAFWSTLHPTPIVKIDTRPELQFDLDLFDVVEVNLAAIGLSYATYRIGGIEHRTYGSENCQNVLTTLYLEPYVSAGDYMQWDVNSVWDTSTVFGW